MFRLSIFAIIILTTVAAVCAQTPIREASTGSTVAQLRPAAAIPDNNFGTSAAVSGNTTVVKADDAAYVFVEPPSGWTNTSQTAKLAPTGEVAISGSTIVTCCTTSSAYVFVRPSRGWTDISATATLALPQPADSSTSIAISGDTIVVGNAAAVVNGNNQQGAAYVFVKPEGGWTGTVQPVATLTASDRISEDLLGSSVAIEGGVIAAGAPKSFGPDGAFYVFVKAQTGWANATQTAKLTTSNSQGALGGATSISGNVIIESGLYAGYVYVKPASGWTDMTETAELSDAASPFDPASVSISGSVIAMGSPETSDGEPSGDVYLFEKPEGGWQTSTIPNLVFQGGMRNTLALGQSVALSGSTLVVGAPYVNNYSGVAYVAVPK